jgi:hypothetical protein
MGFPPAPSTTTRGGPQSPSSPCPKVIFPRPLPSGSCLLSNHLHSEDRPLSTFRGEKARSRFPYGNHLKFHPYPSHTRLPLHISIVFGELFAPLLVQGQVAEGHPPLSNLPETSADERDRLTPSEPLTVDPVTPRGGHSRSRSSLAAV